VLVAHKDDGLFKEDGLDDVREVMRAQQLNKAMVKGLVGVEYHVLLRAGQLEPYLTE
jgi:hypothetical protein